MNSLSHARQHREGQVLLPVLGYVFLSVGLVLAIITLSSNHRKIVKKQVDLDQAMYVAEGGLERGCRYVESNVITLLIKLSTNGAQTNLTGVINTGTYSYCIGKVNSTTFSIVSTGAVNGVTRQVSMLRIYQPTYAEFALWSHVNGAIYIKAGESFNGHVHADDPLYFNTTSGGPDFHAPVTSLTNVYYTQGPTKNGNVSMVEFDDGFELNSYQGQMADVDFSSSASTSMSNIAASVGIVLSGSSTLTFNGTTVKITNAARAWTNHVYTPDPVNGIIYIANRGTTTGANAGTTYLLGGTISGRLSVVGENDMYIRGSMTYTTDPRVNPNSTCALGLITKDDIHVDTTAPDDLEIDAAMMCTGTSTDGSAGSFGVDNYNSGSPRGDLILYGGIVQDTRGAVGTFNASTGLTSTGYNKLYSYDPRFVNAPPPYYPAIAGVVRFTNWAEGPKQ